MGRVLAFPDLKSHSEYRSPRSDDSADPAGGVTSDNVVLFDGIFVEYHDGASERARTVATEIGETHTMDLRLERRRWSLRDDAAKARVSGPDHTPRLRQR